MNVVTELANIPLKTFRENMEIVFRCFSRRLFKENGWWLAGGSLNGSKKSGQFCCIFPSMVCSRYNQLIAHIISPEIHHDVTDECTAAGASSLPYAAPAAPSIMSALAALALLAARRIKISKLNRGTMVVL